MSSSSTAPAVEAGAGVLDDARAERLARAQGYPYPYPDFSYVYVDGVPLPLFAHGASLQGADVDVAGRRMPLAEHLAALGAPEAMTAPRTPLLAYGSNRAPQQLLRKYGNRPGPAVIPVRHGRIEGFDVVYAARLAGYGSVAATIAPSPGTVAAVSVLWLTDAQLDLMHTTEGIGHNVYAYGRLDGVGLELDGGGRLDSVFAYINLDGALLDAGVPIALASVAAEERSFPALDQLGVLRLVRDRLEPGADLDTFVLAHIDDPILNAARCRGLSADAKPFDHLGFTRLLG